jgi:feruloyl esterase
MVDRMAVDHKIDAERTFITGLSAGGAMTAAMLATYPDVFTGGAIIAGLPYGIASNVQQALNGMFQSPAHSGRELGNLVRHASDYKGPWPKLSVWHGSADRTVNPANADEIVKQWLDLHGLPQAPMAQGTVDGYPRQVWWNADGETVVESYTITNMAHGTPLGLADNDERYGVEGAYLIEAGISSSYHIASFFGLTDRIVEVRNPPTVAPAPQHVNDVNPAFKARAAKERHQEQPARRGIDVNAVITKALTAAGLMK